MMQLFSCKRANLVVRMAPLRARAIRLKWVHGPFPGSLGLGAIALPPFFQKKQSIRMKIITRRMLSIVGEWEQSNYNSFGRLSIAGEIAGGTPLSVSSAASR